MLNLIQAVDGPINIVLSTEISQTCLYISTCKQFFIYIFSLVSNLQDSGIQASSSITLNVLVELIFTFLAGYFPSWIKLYI